MKHLIIADPIQQLKPESDTGLSILRASLTHQDEVYWAEPKELYLYDARININAQRINTCAEKSAPSNIEPAQALSIDFFDVVSIRKDPPFNQDFLNLCWMLSLEEKSTHFVNKPSQLLRYHEKMLPFEAYRAGFISEQNLVPTWVGQQLSQNSVRFSAENYIQKPWLGYAGKGVQKISQLSEVKFLSDEQLMLQPFLTELKEKGDRRVFFLGGKLAGHFVRFPAQDSYKANLAQGGYAKLVELSSEEQSLCEQIGSFLTEKKIAIAGADLIGTKLSEINITAPTGFETLIDLGGPNLRESYYELLCRSM